MKAKLFTAAALSLAGLSFIAGQQSNIQGPQRSEPAPVESQKISRSEGQPVETPLVDKLLPKKTDAGKEAAPAIADGTRTADGFFEFDAYRGVWIPVDYGHPHCDFNDAPVTLEHLIREHGHARSSAEKWTREEIEVAHANSHWWEKQRGITRAQAVQTYRNSSCPGGVCPSQSRSRGLLGRWR